MDPRALRLAAEAGHALIVGPRMEPLLVHDEPDLDGARAVEIGLDGGITVTVEAGARRLARGVAPPMLALLRGIRRVVVMRLEGGAPVAAVSVPLRLVTPA